MNFQSKLSNLAQLYKNIYIIAVFDCCRVRKDKPKTMGDPVPEEESVVTSDKGQILCIFSCSAGDVTLADSKLTDYIEKDTFRHVS